MQEICHRHFHRELFSCAFSLLISSTAARVVIKPTTPNYHVLIVRLAEKDCKPLRRRQEGGELDYYCCLATSGTETAEETGHPNAVTVTVSELYSGAKERLHTLFLSKRTHL